MTSFSWKKQWLGDDNPSFTRIVFVGGMWFCMPLLLLGCVIDFLPAEGLHGPRMYWVMGALGLLATIGFLLYGTIRERFEFVSGARSVFRFSVAVVFMPVVVGGAVWLIGIKVLPWAYTRTFGTQTMVETVVLTSMVNSKRTCSYRITGGAIAQAGVRYICTSESLYARYPDRWIVVRLQGKRSEMGFAVVSIEFVRVASTP